MRLNKASSFLTVFYLFLLGWWILIHFYNIKNQPTNLLFAFAYGLIPLFGGVFGILQSKTWGTLKSTLGKAMFFFSLGLISWGIGECIWSYYTIIIHNAIPYPSWSDAGFVASLPLWSIGVFYLSRATGAKYGLKNKSGQIYFFILPIIISALSYYLLVTIARGGSLTSGGGMIKVFFDLAYPIGDIIILTISILVYGLSFKYLGGTFKWPVIITLFGFLFEYFADFGFSYTTTINSFYNGSWVDLLFTTALFLLSFGINSFTLSEK